MKHKDIIIIGGGISGLYCGALLAKKGKNVTLLENHLTVGGLAAGFTRKGYYFDSCMERFVADNVRGYFEELNLYKKLDFKPHTAALNVEGKMYTPTSAKEYLEACAEAFPEDRENLMRLYLEFVEKTADFMKFNAESSVMSYTGIKQMKMGLKLLKDLIQHNALKGASMMMSSFNINLEETLTKYIDKESKLYTLLTGGKYFDIFQKGGNANLMTFIGAICANHQLNQYPYKGFQAMCDEIADIIISHNGKIITRAKAIEIITVNKNAVGVKYIKDKEIHTLLADAVIHAADIRHAYFDLIDPKHSSEVTLNQLKSSCTTRPIPIMYVGIKVDSKHIREYLGGKDELIYYPRILRYSEKFEEKDFYKYAPMIIHASSLLNKEHAPEGAANLQIYLTCAPEGWMNNWGLVNGKKTDQYKEIKKIVITDVLNNLEKIVPEIEDRSLIEVCELGTPYTVERFTGNSGGAHCGFSWDVTKNKFNVGMGKFHSKHEFLENLYFIGQWTGYMGGVTNAMWSARELSKKL
ncbi:MAG: amine oxidase [Clostridia bacterium]|nr:amine oxidase [Clostridia bacterium]